MISEAELAERWRMMEAALVSPSLLLDQQASLQATLVHFWSIEAGMMETLVCLAKGMEVRFLIIF